MTRRPRPRALSAALVASFVFSASPFALADDGFQAEDDGTGQRVIFRDDPLSALPEMAHSATLLVRPSAARSLLLRPRTQFVTEMIKSVENL